MAEVKPMERPICVRCRGKPGTRYMEYQGHRTYFCTRCARIHTAMFPQAPFVELPRMPRSKKG